MDSEKEKVDRSQLLTVSECAERFAKSRGTIYSDIEKGALAKYSDAKGATYIHVDDAESLYGIFRVERQAS